MRLLFAFLFLALSLQSYSQRVPSKVIISIRDSASDRLLDSVKVTFTSYCFREWNYSKSRTKIQSYIVNKTFRKKIRGMCEWTVDFEKDGYIVCQPSANSTPSRSPERVIYMRKIPAVKLRPVD